jgi:heme exporter protein CcmD
MDWSMGGYGFYVWGSYFCTAVVIGLEVFSLVKRKRACSHQVKEDKQEKVRNAESSYVAQAR